MKEPSQNQKPKLLVEFATFEAARFACKNYHYSQCMPAGKLVKFAIMEDDKFIGCVIFGYGANNNLAKSFDLTQDQCCELTRVALKKHKTPVSRIVAICLRQLLKFCPGLKLVASYADQTNQKHVGTIYQAGNWIYLGKRVSKGAAYYIIAGKKMHGRSVRAKWGSEKNIPIAWRYADDQTKLLYVYTFDEKLKKIYQQKAVKYEKRAGSVESGTSPDQGERGGESPTSALQIET